MSNDERVTKDLIQTLEDGKEGFERAAERLEGTDRADLCPTFREFAAQRDRFAIELRGLAAAYGDDIDQSGSVAGAVHRGWMAVKDALSGSSDADGVLDAAEQGEDHAVSEYGKALEEDISNQLRTVIERQFVDVKSAHDTVRAARNAAHS